MTGPIRVLLVDDQALVRAGLRTILAGEDDIEVVGEAGDGREGVRAVTAMRPDVVLMDVRMPRLDGIAATAEISRFSSPPRILVLTTFDLDEHVLGALRAGASGFLLKDAGADALCEAVRVVHAGDALLAPSAARRLVDRFRALPAPAPVSDATAVLTPREREVAGLVARGRSNAEIAGDLQVGEATVKTHVSSLLAKLGVRDRIHVVIHAYEHGIVAPGTG